MNELPPKREAIKKLRKLKQTAKNTNTVTIFYHTLLMYTTLFNYVLFIPLLITLFYYFTYFYVDF